MNGTDTAELGRWFTPEYPLGPEALDNVHSARVLGALFENSNLIERTSRELRPAHIVGRRGAGKTSFLRAPIMDPNNFVVEVNSSSTFESVLQCISGLRQLQHAVLVDKAADLWDVTLRHSIYVKLVSHPMAPARGAPAFATLSRYVRGEAREPLADDALVARFHEKLVSIAEGRLAVQPVWRLADAVLLNGVSHAEASEAADLLLQRLETKVYILIDSLEDFTNPDLDLDHRRLKYTLTGLFRFVGRAAADPDYPYEVRCCFPAELWHDFLEYSSNPLKDFSSTILLHWHARELVAVVAKRLMIYMQLYFPDRLRRLGHERVPYGSSAGTEQFLRALLPEKVPNHVAPDEEPIAYILRHTQLLPRQALSILNRVFRGADLVAETARISPEELRRGVRESERLLVDEIINAYKRTLPQLRAGCASCISHLPVVFSGSELHQVFNRHGKRATELEHFRDFLGLLVEAGVIGRVLRDTNRYVVGEFEYHLPNRLNANEDDALCIHPLFADVFDAKPCAGDSQYATKVVYPYGSDPKAEDYRTFSPSKGIS